jgi:hypothetical protein
MSITHQSGVHSDPETHGVQFGRVTVTVDRALGDCVIRAPRPDRADSVTRFHSLDEMRAAYATHMRAAPTNPIAADYARALKFAGLQIKSQQEKKL